MLIKFPRTHYSKGKIGQLHWEFAKNLLCQSKDFEIQEIDIPISEWPSFYIGDKQIMFDYYDDNFVGLDKKYTIADFCFKTQHTEETIHKKVSAWSQISFMNFDQIPVTNYQASGNLILNNQKCYGRATTRRSHVQSLLKNRYGKNLNTTIYSQMDFYRLVNSCLTYVHVPGYRNNMIDRAHVQMFALGCCIITTYIPTLFPNGLRPIAGIHYVKCADDYSDLCEQIEWIRNNKNEAIAIGQNAKELFANSLTPDAISKHIVTCLNL